QSNDPFALAAVRDAERTAESVSLQKRFPLPWPRSFMGTLALAALAFGLSFLTPLDLLGKQAAEQQQIAQQQEQEQIEETIKGALVEVQAIARNVESNEKIENV